MNIGVVLVQTQLENNLRGRWLHCLNIYKYTRYNILSEKTMISRESVFPPLPLVAPLVDINNKYIYIYISV